MDEDDYADDLRKYHEFLTATEKKITEFTQEGKSCDKFINYLSEEIRKLKDRLTDSSTV